MFNKVIMIGNLTRDIEFQYLQGSNTPLAKSAIATSYKYKGSDGIQKDETCFLDFTIFGRVAEIANQYLHKGSKVMLEGRLSFEQWVGTDGQNRSKHILKVENMKMLGGKDENLYPSDTSTNQDIQQENNNTSPVIAINNTIPEIDIDEEDIPF